MAMKMKSLVLQLMWMHPAAQAADILFQTCDRSQTYVISMTDLNYGFASPPISYTTVKHALPTQVCPIIPVNRRAARPSMLVNTRWESVVIWL